MAALPGLRNTCFVRSDYFCIVYIFAIIVF